MQNLALLVCVCLTMCCIGFLFRAEAVDADSYILGQKLIYAFVTHGMFLMLLFILGYCRLSIPKWVEKLFYCINFLITFVVLTLDYHTLFYKKYWAVPMDGYCILEKEYGFMHTVAVALFGLYMIATVVIALCFAVKNIRTRGRYVISLLIAVMLPCISYIIPKLTGSNNSFQPIAFAAFSVMVIIMIYKNNLYDIENIVARFSIASMEEAVIAVDKFNNFKGCNAIAEKLFPTLTQARLDRELSSKGSIFMEMLAGRMKEFKQDDKIYEVSIKPIMERNILLGKVIKLEDITLQRNYTNLLQARKEHLESELVTLTGYSYTDSLTGLRNRRCFDNDIDDIRKQDDFSRYVICSADLNGLKEINDTYGHVAGDELLIGAAAILTEVFDKHGNIYRTGGDEFFIIMQQTHEEVNKLSDKLSHELATWHGSLANKISVSYGFAYGDAGNSQTIDELVIEADREMYDHKRRFYSMPDNDRRNR